MGIPVNKMERYQRKGTRPKGMGGPAMKSNQNILGSTRPAEGWDNDVTYECQRVVLRKSAPMVGAYPTRKSGGCRVYGNEKCDVWRLYWILQHFPVVCCPYGSSARPTGPQTEGTCVKKKS